MDTRELALRRVIDCLAEVESILDWEAENELEREALRHVGHAKALIEGDG